MTTASQGPFVSAEGSSAQEGLQGEKVPHASPLPPLVMVDDHVRALARQHLEVLGVVVAGVPVLVVHDLPRPERPAQPPLRDRPVHVVGPPAALVAPPAVTPAAHDPSLSRPSAR